MMRTYAWALGLLVGCDDGGGSDPRIIDGSVELDSEVAGDGAPVGDGGVVDALPDLFLPPVERCLARGAVPTLSFESPPIEGARQLQADVDADGDGLPEILLAARNPDGLLLTLLDGVSTEPEGSVLLPGVETAVVMPNLWPATGLIAPQGGRLAVWSVGEEGQAIRLLGPDLASGGAVALPGPARRVQIAVVGAKLFALVDGEDNGCAIFDLDDQTERMRQGVCTVRPGYDANGDGVPEIVRAGGDGTHLLDGVTLASVASHPTAMVLSPAPANLRGQGIEVAGVGREMDRLVVHALDPADLSQNVTPPIPIALRGESKQVEVLAVGMGQRILVDDEALNLRYLKLLEPAAMLRPRSELGSYRFLSWALDTDFDADGVPELRVVGGSGEDGSNTPVAFHTLNDGSELFTLPAERSARYQFAFQRGPVGLGVPTDLDGCEGSELVTLRLGNASRDGQVPTRLQLLGITGNEVWRSEGFNGTVHQVVVAELNGMPPAELLELRSDAETAGASKLRIFAGAAEPE